MTGHVTGEGEEEVVVQKGSTAFPPITMDFSKVRRVRVFAIGPSRGGDLACGSRFDPVLGRVSGLNTDSGYLLHSAGCDRKF